VWRESLRPKNFPKAANRPTDLASNVATKGTCMRVLLIEDDSATAQSIELMLKSESFNVYRRISARKASTSVKSTTTTSSFSI
jgi:PleD family two-component response regulator